MNVILKVIIVLKTQGIFRTSGSMKLMKQLKDEIQKGIYCLNAEGKLNFKHSKNNESIALASLLKLWLRDLTDGVVPKEYYDSFEQAKSNTDLIIEAVKKLNEIHRTTLLYLLRFLMKVQSFSVENKMGITNLAIVFGPCLFRCPCDNGQDKTDQILFMSQSVRTSDFVKNLLVNFDSVEEAFGNIHKRTSSFNHVSFIK